MELVGLIESFKAGIYFKMPNEIRKDYINICEQITTFFERYFMKYDDVMAQGRDIIEYLFSVMQSGDYIKMSDALNYEVKPIIKDALVLIERDNLN